MRSRRAALGAVVAAGTALVAASPASAITLFRGDVNVGTQPVSVAVGNFNGGPMDLAVANEGTDDVSILIGDGFGQFTAGTPVPVGDAPSSVVVGRFNDDAFDDLAVASVGNDNIAIRLGTGAGTFTGTGTVSTGATSDPRAIAAGDLTNDDELDLVSANSGSSTVTTHIGDGNGGFAPDATPKDVSAASSIPAANPEAIATVQLGGPTSMPDTNLDVMVTSQTSDQVLSLLGDGTGEYPGAGSNYTTMLSATDPNPSALAIGHLNPNSSVPANAVDPDLLVANLGPDQVFPGYGIANGNSFSFGGVLATGAGSDPVGLAMGDLDGDGDPDGITANSGTGNATVIISNGDGGTSVDTSHPAGTSPRSVATGAFDGDGRADAVVANFGSDSVTILTSQEPGAPPPPQVTPPVTNPPVSTPAVPAPATAKKCKKKGKKKKCKKKRRRK